MVIVLSDISSCTIIFLTQKKKDGQKEEELLKKEMKHIERFHYKSSLLFLGKERENKREHLVP